jgi:DNA-binding XRE family transcriptional regulator
MSQYVTGISHKTSHNLTLRCDIFCDIFVMLRVTFSHVIFSRCDVIKRTEKMQKNFDLIWAREHVGLTQAAAAAKIGVTRETFSRWESGSQAIPKAKFQRFLDAIELDRKRIPAQRKYGADGYPIGFSRPNTGDWEDDFEEEERRLVELEGDEYAVRERVRVEHKMRKLTHNADGSPCWASPEQHEEYVQQGLADFDAETARLKGLQTVGDLI